jgi:penicillin-binding protein 1A
MFRIVRLSTFLSWCFASILCGGALVLASFYLYLAPNLPSPDKLKTTQLQTPLRIFTADGKKIAEFGEKRRTPVQISSVPPQLIQAFVAAEDNRFFEHSGIDIKGLARATTQLLSTGKIVSGGSTITMQVAKNFFLSREKTFIRKFNEIFLALQIEGSLNKDEILELYLNKIYLGNRAYGIHAAAQVYYGKSIQQLNTAEMAMIAGLPKAPSRYNPIANPERALIRRNWILSRMLELGMIDQHTHTEASQAKVTAAYHGGIQDVSAPYIAEMARIKTLELFGTDAYTSGLNVYLTIRSERQIAAGQALRKGLESYDHRHGYRGPLNNLNSKQLDDAHFLNEILTKTPAAEGNQTAAVISTTETSATLTNQFGESIELDMDGVAWAQTFIDINRTGPEPAQMRDVLTTGDIVEIRKEKDSPSRWRLVQTPQVQGALVSISPRDGAIEALVGGYDFTLSHYNRATQAKRQPGSNFKPFIYLAALEKGNTAATLINDAPIVFDDKNLETVWRPENSSGKFYGPTRLRKALYNSRNLVSIRLLKSTGIRDTIKVVKRFGFDPDSLPKDLSLALGSAAMTPLTVATGYAMLANGGHYIEPYLVSKIEDSQGKELYKANPYTVCDACAQETPTEISGLDTSTIKAAPRIADERAMYILHSMLKDVITKGTGRRALALGRDDIAGKTGTTNDQKDAWFSGFNSELQTTVWVGFDNPKTLGRREYGAKAALPIWLDYTKLALQNTAPAHMKRPTGLITARINPVTGKLASPEDSNAIFEIFRNENAPIQSSHPIQKNTPLNQEDTLSPEDIF